MQIYDPINKHVFLYYAMDISGFFSNLWQKTRGDTEDNGIISTYEINNNKDWKTYKERHLDKSPQKQPMA